VGRPAQSLRVGSVIYYFGFRRNWLVDDYRKVVHRNPKGLSAKAKMGWQSIIALVAAVYLWKTANTPAQTELIVPFLKLVIIPLPAFMFVVLTYFVIVGSSNAVNLTDGLDGLAIMPTAMVSGALAIFAYVAGNAVFSKYLGIPYIPGAGELAVFCGAITGAGLAFFGSMRIPRSIHGRCWRACTGRGDWDRRGDRAPGTGVIHHGWCVCGGNLVGSHSSCVVQINRQARVPHGAVTPPLRTQRLEETQVVVRFWIITMLLVLLGLRL